MKRRRGGYTRDKTIELKTRVSPSTYQKLQRLADQSESAMAPVLRGLVSRGLEELQREKQEGEVK